MNNHVVLIGRINNDIEKIEIDDKTTYVNGKIKCRKTDIYFYRFPTFYWVLCKIRDSTKL